MACLGGAQGGDRRLLVAHLADEDDVRVGTQRRAQRVRIVVGVEPDLALGDECTAVGVQELDRVLDRHDVARARLVDDAQQRRGSRALARAGRARDDDQALARSRPRQHQRRQAKLGSLGRLGDDAEDERRRAAVAHHRYAEAAGVRVVAQVGRAAGLVELLLELGAEDALLEVLGVGDHHARVVGHRDELAGNAHARLGRSLQVYIRCPCSNGLVENAVQVDGHYFPNRS